MLRKQPPLRALNHHALFLDIDGTLADIAPEPALASIVPSTHADIVALFDQLAGALALISGRHLDDIDRIIGVRGLPAAGIHGAQLRTTEGVRLSGHQLTEQLATVEEDIRKAVLGLDGILIERKPLAVAIHFRANPNLEGAILKLAESVVCSQTGLKLMTGKCIAEILPASADKGSAIANFMLLPPFRGRVPVFAGDDVTDEAGFAVVNAMNGISIKIGEGPSRATYGFESAAAMRSWLSTLTSSGEGNRFS